jgi:hypothetical protein
MNDDALFGRCYYAFRTFQWVTTNYHRYRSNPTFTWLCAKHITIPTHPEGQRPQELLEQWQQLVYVLASSSYNAAERGVSQPSKCWLPINRDMTECRSFETR